MSIEETNKCLPPNQCLPPEPKSDKGKPRISLVPMEILNGIARVREFGVEKYLSPDNWKLVGPERYVDAMLRHAMKFAEDFTAVDEESGLPHLWHIACNVAFLCDQLKFSLQRTGKDVLNEAFRRACEVPTEKSVDFVPRT